LNYDSFLLFSQKTLPHPVEVATSASNIAPLPEKKNSSPMPPNPMDEVELSKEQVCSWSGWDKQRFGCGRLKNQLASNKIIYV
jgi:hypothetical protein